MSKISREGYEQIKVIKNALDSMYDKLDTQVFTKEGKTYKATEIIHHRAAVDTPVHPDTVEVVLENGTRIKGNMVDSFDARNVQRGDVLQRGDNGSWVEVRAVERCACLNVSQI